MYKWQIYHIAESNRKNQFGSENRIESKLFCWNWNALVQAGCSSPFLRPWARSWINHWSPCQTYGYLSITTPCSRLLSESGTAQTWTRNLLSHESNALNITPPGPPGTLTMLMYQQSNADAHQVEPVEEVLDATLDVVQWHVLGCSCLLHLHQSVSHRLDHRHVPPLYLVQPIRETTSTSAQRHEVN